jgi:VRR-NUC domain
MTRRKTPEADAQRAIVQALRFVLLQGTIVHHSVNEVTAGDRRSRARQAILVGMGVHPGFADLIVLSQGRVLFLEVKGKTGQLSPAQKTFRDAVQAQGFAWALMCAPSMTHWPPWPITGSPHASSARRILLLNPGGRSNEPSGYQLGHPAARAETHHQNRALASV